MNFSNILSELSNIMIIESVAANEKRIPILDIHKTFFTKSNKNRIIFRRQNNFLNILKYSKQS